MSLSTPGYAFEFIVSVLATFFFALLLRAPLRTVPISAVIGGIGWIILRLAGEGAMAYFISALFVAFVGETLARLFKMPATIFIYAAVIPLIPGVRLYGMMLHIVDGEVLLGLTQGASTLIAMGCIAMAVGVSALMFKLIMPRRKK